MSIISNIETAILGLICQAPRYGYEIEKIIEERGMRNWTEIGFSSIYYVLKRLEKRGLVGGKPEKGEKGKPVRKRYSVTADGRAEIEEKIRHLLSAREKVKDPFDLGIAYYSVLGKREFKVCLKSYIESIHKRIRMLEKALKDLKEKNAPYHVITLFERPLVHEKAEEKWAVAFLEKLDELFLWKDGDFHG